MGFEPFTHSASKAHPPWPTAPRTMYPVGFEPTAFLKPGGRSAVKSYGHSYGLPLKAVDSVRFERTASRLQSERSAKLNYAARVI
jgi:hypothetical protein